MEYEINELMDVSLVWLFNNTLVLTMKALHMTKQNL